jgi:hypothetical protein
MPAKSKKTNAPLADYFDDIIAEHLRATTTTNSTSSSSSSNSSSNSSPAPPASMKIPLHRLVQCCIDGNVAQLRRWAKLGVRVLSVWPLIQAAKHGRLAVVLCLVRELGADPNGADEEDCTPSYMAAQMGYEAVVRCLVKEFGADVNKADDRGATPMYMAAQQGHMPVAVCLARELGANVSQETDRGCTPVAAEAEGGYQDVVLCLVKDFGANVNVAAHDGSTPLMIAIEGQHEHIVRILLKHGADPQAMHPEFGTAADLSKLIGAPAEQIAYLEAKTHCSNPGCTGAGRKTCAECNQVRYCCVDCQHAHWPAHRAECKVAAKARRAAKDE